MADLIDEIEHGNHTWQLKSDARGRVYAVKVGNGRVTTELYKRAKANQHLGELCQNTNV